MTKSEVKQEKEDSKNFIETKIIDNIITDEQDLNQPGLLPPKALLSTPPPTSTKDTSISPWWSEEEPQNGQENETTKENSAFQNYEYIAPNEEIDNKQDNILNISILSFGRSSPKESQVEWKERCLVLATTKNKLNLTKSSNVQKELENIFNNSKDCSMICYLKTKQETMNPLRGKWISIAKTPERCKEHLFKTSGNLNKKTFSDYYTMELGQELSHSSEYVTNAIYKTFSPLQYLSQKYIDSWKDGSQQAFFNKFWNSIQKGDAFYLVKDSTKKLIENALGHDKKPSDKK